MPVLNSTALIDNRVTAIREHHKLAGFARAELDVSGGIDSAVMLMLLTKALGPENITAVYSSINSSPSSLFRARMVAKAAGVSLIEVNATETYNILFEAARIALANAGYSLPRIDGRIDDDPSIMGSLRSTLRAPLGRFMNRLTGGGIRHGTGNEDEDRWLRFYQKGGDGEVDTNPLAMLSKGEVYQLAVALGVPDEVITCLPTPDLWGTGDAHNDEDELSRLSGGVPWTYSRVDPKTGKYIWVGTIERLSRFLDHRFYAWFDSSCIINGAWLFSKDRGTDSISGDWEFNMDALVKEAMPFFPGASEEKVRAWLTSARKWEWTTRHKMNPNCPTFGRRKELLEAGLITDELPEV